MTTQRAWELVTSLRNNRQYTSWLRKLVDSEAVSPTVRAVKTAETILQRGVFVIGREGLVCQLARSVEGRGEEVEARELSAAELADTSGSARLAKDKQKIMPFVELEKELQALAGVVEELRTTSGLPMFDHLQVSMDMAQKPGGGGVLKISVEGPDAERFESYFQGALGGGLVEEEGAAAWGASVGGSSIGTGGGGQQGMNRECVHVRTVKATKAWFTELLKAWEGELVWGRVVQHHCIIHSSCPCGFWTMDVVVYG